MCVSRRRDIAQAAANDNPQCTTVGGLSRVAALPWWLSAGPQSNGEQLQHAHLAEKFVMALMTASAEPALKQHL